MPEEMIKKIKNSILPQEKVCFLSALIVGLIAHLYKITNWLPNWDSLVFRYDSQNMLGLGRWFLPVACGVSSFYDLPFITGLMAIIFFGLGAVCICKMFDVKKNITAFFVGALTITFPSVTSAMMYNYVADGYAIAFFLSTLSALFLTREKPRYVLSSILIAFSSGIYQAYITVTITLLILYFIFEILYKNADIGVLFKKAIKILASGIFGMALYYLVLTLLLKITNTTLLDYQGIKDASSLEGGNILKSLYNIKETFFGYFFSLSNGVSVFFVTNSVMFVLMILLYVRRMIKSKLSFSKSLMVIVFSCLLPFCANALFFINGDLDHHNLMNMGFLAFYLLFVMLYEKEDFKKVKCDVLTSWAVVLFSLVIVFNHIIIANVCYHKLTIAYEKSYGLLVRIADRIEQTENSDSIDKILVLGAVEESRAYSVNLPPDMTGTTDGYIIRADDEVVGQSVLCSALNDYCGKNYQFLSGDEKKRVLDKIDEENIGVWPKSDSILIVDDVIVIKLGD